MNDSDTPRTDAASATFCPYDEVETLCRELERENEELRTRIKEHEREMMHLRNIARELQCTLEEERAAWDGETARLRARIARLQEEVEAHRLMCPTLDGVESLQIDNVSLKRENAQLRAALQPFAGLLDSDLGAIGGGTLIAPTINVQMVKDAKAALAMSSNACATLPPAVDSPESAG